MTWNLMFDFLIFNDILPENEIAALGAILGAVYGALFVMRIFRVLKKRTCPACSGKLSRKQRTVFDKIATLFTLNILPFRRYKCIHCGSDGLRWNNSKQRKSDAY